MYNDTETSKSVRFSLASFKQFTAAVSLVVSVPTNSSNRSRSHRCSQRHGSSMNLVQPPTHRRYYDPHNAINNYGRPFVALGIRSKLARFVLSDPCRHCDEFLGMG